jgi:PIN domain nuclease of toxin-antitoxin system
VVLLVAQAQLRAMTMVSVDGLVTQYDVDVIW